MLPLETPPEKVTDADDAEFLKEIAGYCRLNTVRDALAQRLWASVGVAARLLPCPAFFSPDRDALPEGEYIVLNYMEGAGHYDWGQCVDAGVWRAAFKTVIERLKKTTPLRFVCHDQKEMAWAETLDASIPRYLPTSMPEYFAVLAKAKGGICNRLHAAVALAGVGVPAIGIGTDTRLLMLSTLGLPALFVKEATAERVLSEWDALQKKDRLERERLRALRESQRGRTLTALREAVPA